ncbi:TOG array regulator of axonemal microtubules protein 1-like isoform X2 [Brachyhypopomus gauderio]|uniref:TOG array regulator of axonemal microtubules protein 1-like isoform X2 n=1 Tax=Brachyhypopomus gauderio TaxID=698409 RepID=UPI00404380C0
MTTRRTTCLVVETGEVGSSRCPPLSVLTSRTRVTLSRLIRPSLPTHPMLPPFTKPAGREPLRAFRPAKDELKPEPLRKDPHEQQTLRPFAKPDLALAQSFRMLSSNDGEKKIEGMMFIRRLAQYHSVVLGSRLHDVCIVLIQEVRNLHSRVSRMAVVSLRELYSSLQKGMDQEVEATAKVLLHKAVASNAFIRQDVDTALDSMVQNCTPIRSMNALLAEGLCHQNAAVRKCTARHLATLVEKIGAGRLLSGAKNVTARIIPAVSKLAQDSSKETRCFGRRMLQFLSSHHDFDKMVEKYIPAKDRATIRDTVHTLKSKERTKVSRIDGDKMRQPCLEQQEAPAAQVERQNTQGIKRSLRHTVRDVSPDDAAPLKGNG